MLDSNATPRMVQRHYGSRDCRPLRELIYPQNDTFMTSTFIRSFRIKATGHWMAIVSLNTFVYISTKSIFHRISRITRTSKRADCVSTTCIFGTWWKFTFVVIRTVKPISSIPTDNSFKIMTLEIWIFKFLAFIKLTLKIKIW